MNKLSLDALKQRAEAIASEDLLATISGGTENCCHEPNQDIKYPENIKLNLPIQKGSLPFTIRF